MSRNKHFQTMEMAIVKGLSEYREIRGAKIKKLLDSNLFNYCQCDYCQYQDDYSKALVMKGCENFFFRVISINYKHNNVSNKKFSLIIYKFGDKDEKSHILSRVITLEDLIDSSSDDIREIILFNLDLFLNAIKEEECF